MNQNSQISKPDNSMLTLDVLICTYTPDGIRRVAGMNLPALEGVTYIVSWQEHADAPVPDSLASRSDVRVFRLGQKGLSLNRNNAIENSTSDIYLIADDDLRYSAARIEAVRKVFEEDPTLDYASFMYEDAQGRVGDCKVYPTVECDLRKRLPKGFYQTSFEIAVRRRGLAAELRFHPAFGLGSPWLHAAEEEMFLLTARRLKLNCRFFPIVIATHDGPTTGNRPVTDPCVLRAWGAYLYFAYPFTFPARVVLKARRLDRAGQSRFLTALREMLRGVGIGMSRVNTPWEEVRR
ncbi:glycosyltransferase [uncultured Duncaniella sp.]|uniref:glycosyltransferase n=2 Tax=uncultured Duncaniella sp. TaxID=2768039 RepID=UPI00260A8ED2|nr:glycosyltransferase [uncultured Duncaniella sp.]